MARGNLLIVAAVVAVSSGCGGGGSGPATAGMSASSTGASSDGGSSGGPGHETGGHETGRDETAGDETAGDGTGADTTGTQPMDVPPCSTDLTAQLDGLGVPGLSAGIVANGRLVCTAVAGMADIEADRSVEPPTVFEWASVSKTIVATAVMILHEEGHFDLDDDVNDHLPFSVHNPNCPDDPITFRQLLTHTSSIIDNETVYDGSYTVGDSPIPLGDWTRDYLTPDGLYYDADENFDSDCPGEYNEYSNIAVGGVLGHAVETIAGQAFDDFCRERIFEPLGMTETSFRLSNLDVDRVATPYEAVSDGGFEALGHHGYATFPDGLLRTSVPNLARFLLMMAGDGVYDGQRILAETSTQQMRQVQIPSLDDTQGLIWFYDFDGTLLGHDGEDDGAASLMYFDPTDGTGALLVANAIWWDTAEDEAYALFRVLMDEAKTY